MPPFVEAIAEVLIVEKDLVDAVEAETLAGGLPS
jgi:hypothetical protein